MATPSLSLCYASAGAGKTHTLVHNYLLHTLKSPADARATLAITFTNAATQEMKKRLLETLYALSEGRENKAAAALQEALDWDATTLTKRAKALLKHVLHHYQDFSVTTIDALFQKMVRTFTYELNIPTSYKLLLQAKPFLEAAMTQLWEALSEYPSLEKSLVTLALHKMQQGKSWDPTSQLASFAQHSLLDNPQEKTKNEMKTLASLDSFFQQLADNNKAIKKRLASMAKKLLNIIDESAFSRDDFAFGQRGILGFLDKTAHYQEATPSNRIRKTAEDSTRWGKKGDHALASFATTSLQPLLQELLQFYDDNQTFYLSTCALQPLYYALAANIKLGDFLAEQYALEHVIPMAELPKLLQQVLETTPATFLYQKLGTAYKHLLIDEFQDVSDQQWERLRPLLQHILQDKGSGFLVGDVKQAIYRWRGGNAQLFLTKVAEDFSQQEIEKKNLPYNWRSAPNIIHFNNKLFVSAANIATKTLQEKLTESLLSEEEKALLHRKIEQIQQAYRHTTQEVPPEKANQEETGYVELNFLPRKKESDPSYQWKQEAVAKTIQITEELQKRGHKPSEIAILIRTHQEAAAITEAFALHEKSPQAHKDITYTIAANSKVRLGDNPYVKLLLRALHYIHNPKEGWPLTLLIHSYYMCQQGADTTCKEIPHSYWQAGNSLEKASHYLPKVFLKKIDTYAHLPLTTLIHTLIHDFEITSEVARPYLHNFQEAIHSFASEGGHLGSFFTWWEKEGKQTPIPSAEEKHAISINTIHQVKGLAFDTIITPFCEWSLDHSPHHPPILSCHTDTLPFDKLSQAPLYYGRHLKETYYSHEYYDEQWQAYLDNLNLLYVACTRARKELYLFASPTGEKLASVGNLLEASLHDDESSLQAIPWQKKEDNGHNTFYYGKKSVEKQAKEPPCPPTSQQASPPRAHTLHHQKILAAIHPERGNTGAWWHTLLAQVESKQDLAPLIASYLKANLITPAEGEEITRQVATWWEHDKLHDWFSGRWQIKREKAILFPDGRSLRPDRVMVRNNCAIVLDFKTGAPQATHSTQVAQYVTLLEEMGYQDVEGYLFYTTANKLVGVT